MKYCNKTLNFMKINLEIALNFSLKVEIIFLLFKHSSEVSLTGLSAGLCGFDGFSKLFCGNLRVINL